MPIAPEPFVQYIPRGVATVRGLRVGSGATSLTLSGTYTLYDSDGLAVSTGAFTSNAYSLTLSGSAEIGAGWSEVWEYSTGGRSYATRRRVIVTETLDNQVALVDHQAVLAVYPWLADMPSGYTSWEPACYSATLEVLAVVADRTAQGLGGSDLLNADSLFWPALHAALRNIGRAGAALTGAAGLQAMADTHEAEYRDWLRRLQLKFDTDGDGVADRTDRIDANVSGHPPPSPIGV